MDLEALLKSVEDAEAAFLSAKAVKDAKAADLAAAQVADGQAQADKTSAQVAVEQAVDALESALEDLKKSLA